MRSFGRWMGRLLLALIVGVAGLWLFGPYEPVDRDIAFDPASLGADLEAYIHAREAGVAALVPGAERQIVWAKARGAKTPLPIVYLHGFSASAQEVRPLPDKVANALGANLYFARFSGHGRDGAAMAGASAGDWIEDTAEALAIGRRLGERVLIIATSTGGTLAALAAQDPDLRRDLEGVVLISPNFRIANPAGALLTWPAARHWVGLVAGEERGFEPLNDAQERFWTTRYPTVSVLPMAALVKHARDLDYSDANVPALFVFSDHDQVVSAKATRQIADRWGGDVTLSVQGPGGEGVDPFAHVLAGDIVSPARTQALADEIVQWAGAIGKN